jgi:tetratricopeptide (TPR) repeat protein
MRAQPAADSDGDDQLLALALSRPNEAMARARAILAAAQGPRDASVAHQVIGIVLREFGDIDAAVRELRTARRLACRGGSVGREADVLATLGVALVFAGRTRSGRNALNWAVLRSAGLLRGRTLLRRAGCLRLLGDYRAALDDLNSAIPLLRAAGDQIWEARALNHRALCLLALGSIQPVAADLRRAEELFAACGQELEYADVIANRGLAAFRTSQLPDALACFDAAEDLYTALSVHEPDLSAQRCAALVAAGLAADAVREADAAIGRLERAHGQATMRAELLLVAANCALAAGDPGTAADRAAEAARLFGRQDRSWWRVHARLAQVRAAAGAAPVTAALLRDARRSVRELDELGSPDLPFARLTAGRAALALAASTERAQRRGAPGPPAASSRTPGTGPPDAGTATGGTAPPVLPAPGSPQPSAQAAADPNSGNAGLVFPAPGPSLFPGPAAGGKPAGRGHAGQRAAAWPPADTDRYPATASAGRPGAPAQGSPRASDAAVDRPQAGPGNAATRRAARLRAEADKHLAAVAAGRRQGPALSRATAWLAQALRAEAAGDARGLMRACRRGLAVIDEFRSVFGSSELRAQSTAHGAELAALGLRHAARLGRPRLMLEWSERWRAVALAVPPVRPPADEALQADLAALRDVSDRLVKAAPAGRSTGPLELERQRLERAVRARSLHARQVTTAIDAVTGRIGQGARSSPEAATSAADPALRLPFGTGALLDELGDDRLIELVDVDGELHALVCGEGRVRRYPVGSAEEAARGVRFARQALRRVAHGPAVSPDGAAVHAWLAALGERLDQVLLGEAGERLGSGNVVVVPPGRLQAVPWGLLPRLRSRAVSVAPSATSWLRARRAAGEVSEAGDASARTRLAYGRDAADQHGPGHAAGTPGGRVVLVRGPGLASGGAEVPLLAADYTADASGGRRPAPVVLGWGTATAGRVLDAIDGAGLVHIAAHGTFRADSPLFSALRLDDGPLTVYDLERLRRGPRRLVLSSCDSGVTAPAGADEVLGLASSLLPLGTTGIVASVVPVNDEAVVPLMTALHRELRGGAPLPEALRRARPGPESDPVAAAAGWSFICLGA